MSSLSPPPGAGLAHVGGRRPLGSTPTAPSPSASSSTSRPTRNSMQASAAGSGAGAMRGPPLPASAPPAAAIMPHGGAALGTLAPGTLVRVGAYTCTIKRYLSQGGFAHVYLVTVPQPIPMPPPAKATNLLVLKRMAVPDKEALVIVRNEVETHKQLRSHPFIAHFLEASASTIQAPSGSPQGSAAGGYEIFILMEYCPGGGLIDLMNARLRNRLREAEILHIFAQVCEGVAHMHHQDPPILHRDLKVENILLVPPPTSQGPPGSLASCSHHAESISFKLCDFGSAVSIRSRSPPASMDAARALEADLNRHTTLQYRAPEMVDVYRRPPVAIGEPADIWALGILLYKLCYYTTPFEENGGGPLAILNVRYRFPPQPAYSESLKGVIKSILVERPEARPSIDRLRVNVARLRNTSPPAEALQRVAAEDGVPMSSSSSSSTKALPSSSQSGTGKASLASVSTSSSAPSTPDLASSLSSPLPPLPTRASPNAAALEDDLITFRDDASRNGGIGAAGRGMADGAGTSAKAEMDKELRELEAQMDSKASMRRGRPTKAATLGPVVSLFPSSGSPSVSASAKPSPGLEKPSLWTESEATPPLSPPIASPGFEKQGLWTDLKSPSPASIQQKLDLWAELEKPYTSKAVSPIPSPSAAPNLAATPAPLSVNKSGLWTDLDMTGGSGNFAPKAAPPLSVLGRQPSFGAKPAAISSETDLLGSSRSSRAYPPIVSPSINSDGSVAGVGRLGRSGSLGKLIGNNRSGEHLPTDRMQVGGARGGGGGTVPATGASPSGPSVGAIRTTSVAARVGLVNAANSPSASSPSSAVSAASNTSLPNATGGLLAPLGVRPQPSPACPNGGIIRPKPIVAVGVNQHRSPALRPTGSGPGPLLKPIPNVGLVKNAGPTSIGRGPSSNVYANANANTNTNTIASPKAAASRFPDLSTPPPSSSPDVGATAANNNNGSSDSNNPSPTVAEEPFRGVSNLIARWQAHAENPSSSAMSSSTSSAAVGAGAAAAGTAGNNFSTQQTLITVPFSSVSRGLDLHFIFVTI
ncbi:unnamed protein product [Tilletia controversa]|uniref:non-specific serine/threonine protein kinase n=2 Tax=Tilletia TaxID=13289 RepID=A0ABN7JBN8_9BASI|nr:unnamed protein product [Tilletia controversa]CAD6960427.1 unnamed protein product [Tilletia caries]